MKRLLALMIFSAAVLTSCGPSVRVSTDKDPNANFTQYKSFQFAPEVLERTPKNKMLYDRFLGSIEAQMNARGIVRSANPDMFINLYLRTQEKVSVSTNTNYYGGYYRYGYGPGWGGAYGTTYTDVNQYTDGYVFCDFVDANTNTIVFQGILNAEIEEDTRYMSEVLEEGLRRMFRDFPVRPLPVEGEE
jgi:hypothetical protein